MTTRTVTVTDGSETRTLQVESREDGTVWLWDPGADPNADSLQQIQDDSDTAIMDAIRDNGFEIVAE